MKYFIRSLKYFVALCVICVAILALMLATGTSALTLDQTVYVMFHTSRYATLFAAIVVLAALYPKFGVRGAQGRRRRGGEPRTDHQRLQVGRLSLRGEEDGVMTFRADGPLRKLMLLGEDEIKVSQYGQWIQIDGIRRGVARVEYRLDSYIQMSKHD